VKGIVPRVASVFGNHDIMKLRARLKRVEVFDKGGKAGIRLGGPPWLNEEDRELVDKRGLLLEPEIFATAREQLAALGDANVGFGRRDYNPLKLSVAGARPFSSGGKWLPNLYEHLWGFTAMRESAAIVRRRMCEESPEDHQVLLLAHNGPHGLGSEPDSICGKDWPSKNQPAGGDWGDMDTESALHKCNRSVPLVVFGHMHEGLIDGSRRTLVVRTRGRTYVNAAVVPRWRSSVTPINISTDVVEWAQQRHATGQPIERHFTLIELTRTDRTAKWRVGNVEGLWVLHDGKIVERTPLCAKDAEVRQKPRPRLRLDVLPTETDVLPRHVEMLSPKSELEKPIPRVEVERSIPRVEVERPIPKLEAKRPTQRPTPRRSHLPARTSARPELQSNTPIWRRTFPEREKERSALPFPMWKKGGQGRVLSEEETRVSPQTWTRYRPAGHSTHSTVEAVHGVANQENSVFRNENRMLGVAQHLVVAPEVLRANLIKEGEWGDDGPPAGWPLFHPLQRGAQCAVGLADGNVDSGGGGPVELSKASWMEQWQASLEKWWTRLPLSDRQTMSQCLRALGLHISSHVHAALNTWQLLLGKPPLSPKQPPKGVAEPGCEWLGERDVFDVRDVPPEFPAKPFEPDAFKIPVLSIPYLLPDFQRQRHFIESLDGSQQWYNVRLSKPLQPEHWQPSHHSRQWVAVGSGVAASLGVTLMVTLILDLAKRRSRAIRDDGKIAKGKCSISTQTKIQDRP